jgi:hypothetical protein
VRGHAGIGRARAAGPALLAIAAAALCLAGPAAASAAQQPTGTALASSYNGYGDLGDGSSTMFSTTPVAVDLPAGTRVTAIAAGDGYSLALTSDGNVLAWGDDERGELGDGSRPRSSPPRPSRWTCPRAPASPPSPPV